MAGIVTAFLVLTFYTWATWGDVQIDTGHELYTPSSLAKGRLLYRDVWYQYGPLSPYVLALLFRLFGVHWNVLYLFGLTLTLTIALLLYHTARRVLPVLAASLVSLAFLLQGFVPDLFNQVVPYSYAASIGSLLGIACLYFLVRRTLGETGPNLLFAGLAAGLALLCKQEFGFACYLVLGFVLVLECFDHRSFAAFARGISFCIPGILINVFVYGWFIWQLSSRFIFMENFQFAPNTPFMRDFGERWIADHGLRFLPQELLSSGYTAFLSVAVWFLLACALRYSFRDRWIRIWLGITVGIGVAGYLMHLRPVGHLWAIRHETLFPIGMFWVACWLFVHRLVGALRKKPDRTQLAQLVVAAYGLAVGIRIMVEVVRYGYAIYYNSILFLAFIIVLTEMIGKVSEALPKRQQALLMTMLLSLEGIGLTLLMLPYPDVHPAPLVTRIGTVYTRRTEARLFPQIIEFMQEQKSRGKNVLVLPEEELLYVASGTEAPTRWHLLAPGVLDTSQEGDYIAQLESSGIDYILLSNRSTYEYGVPFWGLDYNKQVYRWIQDNYEVKREFGRFLREGTQPFAMLLYERRARTTDSMRIPGVDSLGDRGTSRTEAVRTETKER